MKIALVGYGKMGKTIEEIALGRGHEIVEKIDINLPGSFDSEAFASADVVIEFTVPQVAYGNYIKCFERNKPVVSGTTGWLDKMPEIEKMCKDGKQTFFYSSNFSLGVNIFFEINRRLAAIMNKFDNYDVNMVETHHIHKLDAPSGTAISLAEGIIGNLDRKKEWNLAPEYKKDSLQIAAIRQGEVPGIHTITYDSDVDYIEITHSAKSRRGFAFGVVLAAEYTYGKKGLLGMKDMLGF
ncbi:MAG: 4-hydroxy-tetrahydrodipicolinate reductase [Bacteroidales bacterium]|nr:4-hydroxy-tetrahydrodipicolinate reductase [Bacteroidales bacterium]